MKYIDLLIASAEVGVEKPDRHIFELALERAGCKPEEAAMVGDRLDNDIVPANEIYTAPKPTTSRNSSTPKTYPAISVPLAAPVPPLSSSALMSPLLFLAIIHSYGFHPD